MVDTALDQESSWLTWGERDYWPFIRMLIVAFSLGVAAHLWLGWRLDLRPLLAVPGQVLGILSILALISFALAELYLLLFVIPIYIVGVLNDWFYDATHWTLRIVLRLRSRALLAVLGLCGEIAIFGGLGLLIRQLSLRI